MLQGNKPVFIAVNDVGLHVIAVDTKVNLCKSCFLNSHCRFLVALVDINSLKLYLE